VTVVSQVTISFEGALDAVVADDGTLVYVPGQAQSLDDETLVWVDRQGREEPLEAPPRVYYYPRLAPDGTRLALSIFDQERDIWLWDLARATLTRVTVDQGFDTFPVWTPDGRRLLFSSERAGARNLFAQAADGTGAIERLTETTTVQSSSSISPDGAWLVFTDTLPGTGQDVMLLPLGGDRKPAPLIQTPFTERNGEISPDGRWIAYEANDSVRFEIYVRPFPKVMDGRWQVSTGGGTRPLWARNGQELFYRAVVPTAVWTTPFPMGALMRVGVERSATWAATAPVPLFEGRYLMGMLGSAIGRTYDISPDGRRFLMIKPVPSTRTESTSIVVVQNWQEELKRLVPTR
jgi:serine/threonine-protein kinase